MAIDLLKTADLEKVRPDKVVTLLFGYRKRLLEAARDDAHERQTIFEFRAEIAAVFRQFGDERLRESAQQFESLKRPDDLLKFAPPKKERAEEPSEDTHHSPGFYVFGDELNYDRIKSIRSQNRSGSRMGNPIPLTLIRLFRVEDDNRPIYINQPRTPKLQKQIDVLIHIKPDIKKRLHFVRWEGDRAIIEPYAASASPNASTALLSPREAKAAKMLGKVICHKPHPGEIFIGRITRVNEIIIVVEILPGIEGVASRSNLPQMKKGQNCTKIFQIGDEIAVQVISVEYIGSDWWIKLSARTAAEEIERGEKPLFANVKKQLLLPDS